jgi:UDPglucose--hexose-1-phosphate uridylyltransferase
MGKAKLIQEIAVSDNDQFVREIRIDPVVPTESVLVFTAHGQRLREQEELAPHDTREHVKACPFCRGNEHMTPPEISAYSYFATQYGRWRS